MFDTTIAGSLPKPCWLGQRGMAPLDRRLAQDKVAALARGAALARQRHGG